MYAFRAVVHDPGPTRQAYSLSAGRLADGIGTGGAYLRLATDCTLILEIEGVLVSTRTMTDQYMKVVTSMLQFIEALQGLYASEETEGQGLVEYALILVLVAIVVIGSMALVGKRVAATFCSIVLQIGGSVPAGIANSCSGPQIAFSGISDGQTTASPITVEAVLTDPKTGSTITNAQSVKFYLDGNLMTSEFAYRYCLGGGNASCNSLAVAQGTHTLKAVGTDSSSNTGETTISFTIS